MMTCSGFFVGVVAVLASKAAAAGGGDKYNSVISSFLGSGSVK
jgi:hypothetical protein